MATALRHVDAFHPLLNGLAGAYQSITNYTMDASGKKIAVAFQAEEDATISGLGFRYGVRTGTPPTYRISLQSLDASGNPDGTVLGGGTPASATFTPPASTAWNSTWQWITLSNTYAVTRGTYYAWVIDYSSGTIDGSNNGSFTQEFRLGTNGFPYYQTYGGASWAKTTGGPAVFGYQSGSKNYGFPFLTATSTAMGTGATPDEIGLKFQLPTTFCSTFKVIGASGLFRLDGSSTVKMILYDTDGTTVLQSMTFDTDHFADQFNNRPSQLWSDESTLSTLTAGSWYRLVFQPQSASNHWYDFNLDFESDTSALAIPWGDYCNYTSRTDAGAWTDDASKRPLFGLQLQDVTAPSGGSAGMLYIPSLDGI